ncbi:MAG: hypothetical protein JNM56_22600 [Planctomycetia bacterium]|nr:hypothetical protein [Planctomycetia bacterium]
MHSALEVLRSDDQIAELVQAFEAGTLPRPAWTHGAHLTVALCYLRRWPRPLATERLRQAIQRYNAVAGSGMGYHETITLAWIAVVAQYLAEHDFGQSSSSLTAGLLERCGDKHYLQRFYSPAVLMSETARRAWTPPDLSPIEPDAR